METYIKRGVLFLDILRAVSPNDLFEYRSICRGEGGEREETNKILPSQCGTYGMKQ